ncbi:MAG: hypothetical protein LWW83_16105 [Azonexaceae bacterium]|nr:hypothetical protein [Azonexaceae bacterium]
MIDKTHDQAVVRQAQLQELSRSSVYYQAQPTSESDLKLMRRIDELHLEHPFARVRMLRDMLKLEGHEIVHKQLSPLMRKLDIQAVHRKANTNQRNQAHRIYSYLLRNLTSNRPNQNAYIESFNGRFEKENGLEEAVFRRADHRLFAAGGSRCANQGTVSAARLS